jgi:sugar/nucleoside kinase (ribokinase family)
MSKDKQIDILAIGDIAINVFIKIKDAETKCDSGGEHCKLCINFGTKIPYESALVCYAVGNSSNVAICTSRLGLKTALIANIGDDQNGINCLNTLKEEKVDTTFVKKESGASTNYHYVLWYNKEHTILTKHENYQYQLIKTEEYGSPSWIYLSSLGDNSLTFYNEIIDYLKEHINAKLVFSPGTFQIKLGIEALKDIYRNTEVFICNHEEAQTILKIQEENIPKLTKMIHDLGPKIVVITNGIKGAYSYDGNNTLFMNAVLGADIETTGAGDSFSGAFVSALCLGKSIEDALIWGMVNSMSVVSFVGPHEGLLTRNQIEDYIKKMSNDYKPIKIS